MDISKLFMVFLLLIKAINSERFNYCDNTLFKAGGLNWLRSAYGVVMPYPTDYKRQAMENTNTLRNKLNTPMNYVNWDNELEEVALNILKKILDHDHCGKIEERKFFCLVSTPSKKELFVIGDKTRVKINENITIAERLNLTKNTRFSSIANIEPNIISVGCNSFKVQVECPEYEGLAGLYLLCLFSGINGPLLTPKNENWKNLYGPNCSIVDTKHNKLDEFFNIDEIDIYGVLYGLNVLIYSLIIMFYVFVKCLKSFHRKLLLEYVEY